MKFEWTPFILLIKNYIKLKILFIFLLFLDCPNLMMSRFMKIVEMKDKNLHSAVARAIYAISCGQDNIPKMADCNILQLIKILWDDRINNEEENKIYQVNKKIQDDIIMKEIKDMKIKGAKIPKDYATLVPSVQINHLLLACLYNLSTCPESQNKLVTDSFIEIIVSMWDVAKKDKKTCLLACYAVYHMACGLTSSARLLSSGCIPILCFLYTAKKQNLIEYKGYVFPIDLRMRCSMAIRNLMCVVSNQEELVRAGCVDALVDLAHDAETELNSILNSSSRPSSNNNFKKSTLPSSNLISNNNSNGISNNNNNDSNSNTGPNINLNNSTNNSNNNTVNFKNGTHLNAQTISQNVLNTQNNKELLMYEETRQHCAAALRNLTFNKTFRHDLNNENGAITVLLDDLNADMKDENFPIDYNLLCELEAESWQNGSRTKGIKEGRAIPISTAPLNKTLLSIIQTVDLDITVKSAILQKYRVTVELEEPKIEQGTDVCDDFQEDLSTLTIFDNNEDNNLLSPLLSERIEWKVLDIKAALTSVHDSIESPSRKKSTVYLDSLGVSSNSSTFTTVNIDENLFQKLLIGASPLAKFSPLDSNVENDEEGKEIEKIHRFSVPRLSVSKSADTMEMRKNSNFILPEVKSKINSLGGNNKKNSEKLSRKKSGKVDISLSTELPAIRSKSILAQKNGITKKSKTKTKTSLRVVPKKEEIFNNLVTLINQNKKTKGDINDVLKKWSKIPK